MRRRVWHLYINFAMSLCSTDTTTMAWMVFCLRSSKSVTLTHTHNIWHGFECTPLSVWHLFSFSSLFDIHINIYERTTSRHHRCVPLWTEFVLEENSLSQQTFGRLDRRSQTYQINLNNQFDLMELCNVVHNYRSAFTQRLVSSALDFQLVDNGDR